MKNRIEAKFEQLKKENKKAFVNYITAGLPDMDRCAGLIKAMEEAGLDIIELGVPFSDPTADGPVIQDASYRSIQKGTTLRKTFDLVERVRKDGVKMPIVFMLYYNTIMHYGVQKFVDKCSEVGVDGIIVPDLPLEEQDEIKEALNNRDETILIELVAPVSKDRIPKIVDKARGFIYCVSAMGVTGNAGQFHKNIINYLTDVKKHADIPVLMGFGIRTPEDVAPMKDIIDGAIVGTYFIQLMEKNNYDYEVAKEYIRNFKAEF